MKKLLGVLMAVAFAFVLAQANATDKAAATAPAVTTVEQKAQEVCKQKGLAGDLWDKCVKEEVAKAGKPQAAAATTTTTQKTGN